MIYMYTGTPGAGKSYHATADVLNKLKRKNKKNIKFSRVIANYFLDVRTDDFFCVDNSDLTVDYLVNFAKSNHIPGIENQTLVVIDECQILFNSRNWNSQSKERMNWLTFFSQHRKYGYNFIMICQADFMIDKQIRGLVEYEVAHMKINNFFALLPIKAFLAVTRWYGQRMKVGHEVIFFKKNVSKVYNSFGTFVSGQSGNDQARKSVADGLDIQDNESLIII